MKLLTEIDFDENANADFILWFHENNDNSLLKKLILMGFYSMKFGNDEFCRKQIMSNFEKKFEFQTTENNNLRNELDNQKRIFLEDKDRVKKEIENQNKLLVELEVLRQKQTIEEQQRQLFIDVDKYKNLYSQTLELLSNQNSNLLGKEIEHLHQMLEKKENDINILKRSNAGKGNKGEEMIVHYLKEKFTDCIVENTGKMGHSCDVRLTYPNGNFIAIESKYKESGVTRGDITKFQSDIKALKSSNGHVFNGGVFVSIKNKNIPLKSDIHFEIIDTTPVCYLGFQDEEDFEKHFYGQISIFMKLASCEFACINRKTLLDDLLNQLVPFFDKLRKMKCTIQKMRSSLDDLDKTYLDIMNETDLIMTTYLQEKTHLPVALKKRRTKALA